MTDTDQPNPPASSGETIERGLVHDVVVTTVDALATGTAAYVGAKLGAGSGSGGTPPEPPTPTIILPAGVERPDE